MFAKADINADSKLGINEWVFVEQLCSHAAQHETRRLRACSSSPLRRRRRRSACRASTTARFSPAIAAALAKPAAATCRGTAADMLETSARGSLNLIDDVLIRGGELAAARLADGEV